MKIAIIENLNVDQAVIDRLVQPLKEAGHEVIYYPETSQDPNVIRQRCQEADIVTIANTPFPAEVLDSLNKLQYLNVAFTGVNHVPVQQIKEKNITLSNAAGYSNTAVSELVLGMSLNLLRQIQASNEEVRMGQTFPGIRMGIELKGKTIGIIGTGKIGGETARLFNAFGCHLLGYSHEDDADLVAMGMQYVSLEDLLQSSDIVSLHLPLNDHTHHFIGENELRLMKNTALLINCARGPVVDQLALAKALNDQHLAGAGVDVYEVEPPLANDHPLFSAKNVLLTPHIGYFTKEAMEKRAEIAFDNIWKFIEGQPQNLI